VPRRRKGAFITLASGLPQNAALPESLRVKDDLIAGRTPRPAEGQFTVTHLCNSFLEFCEGRTAQRTFDDYKNAAALMVKVRLIAVDRIMVGLTRVPSATYCRREATATDVA